MSTERALGKNRRGTLNWEIGQEAAWKMLASVSPSRAPCNSTFLRLRFATGTNIMHTSKGASSSSNIGTADESGGVC